MLKAEFRRYQHPSLAGFPRFPLGRRACLKIHAYPENPKLSSYCSPINVSIKSGVITSSRKIFTMMIRTTDAKIILR